MEGLGLNSFWRDRPVFVTGATGLVGGWLVKRLVAAGADVVCLVRDWVPQSEFFSGGWQHQVRIVRGDLCDQPLLERVLGEYEVATVMHLAAQAIVGIANRNPVSTFETNIAGTWKLLEACRRSPLVKQIVVASSDKAYGDCDTLPYSEETPAGRPASLRRQQVVRGPHRAELCRDVRLAGLHHAVRQLLRRRRSELEPHRSRHDPLGASRPAPGDPLRRAVRSRLLLRRGRRGGVHAARGENG